MQVSYQTQPLDVKPSIGIQSNNMLAPGLTSSAAAQKFYNQDLKTVKSENENYQFKTVYSPFLSPSNVVISERVASSKAIDVKFAHNEARTRYFFVSKPARTNDHLKRNLLA